MRFPKSDVTLQHKQIWFYQITWDSSENVLEIRKYSKNKKLKTITLKFLQGPVLASKHQKQEFSQKRIFHSIFVNGLLVSRYGVGADSEKSLTFQTTKLG